MEGKFPLKTLQVYMFFHTRHQFLKVKYGNPRELHETDVKYNGKKGTLILMQFVLLPLLSKPVLF